MWQALEMKAMAWSFLLNSAFLCRSRAVSIDHHHRTKQGLLWESEAGISRTIKSSDSAVAQRSTSA